MTHLRKLISPYLFVWSLLLNFPIECFSQTDAYYYSTIRSPLFTVNDTHEYGLALNNHAFDFSYSRQMNKTSIVFAFQPNFNDQKGLRLMENTGLTHLSPLFARHAYSELLVTKRQKTKRDQDFWLGGGIGYQSYKEKLRLFGQLDWGNHARLINAGFSVRASIYDNSTGGALRLEPAVTGKFKFGPLRLTNQLGYSILVTKERVPMALLFTVGLSYVH